MSHLSGWKFTPYKQYGVSCRVTRLEVRHRSCDINILNKVFFVVFVRIASWSLELTHSFISNLDIHDQTG